MQCRLVACPAGSESWDFYFINDTSEVIEAATLQRVLWEWGDVGDVKQLSATITRVPPGGHDLLWHGSDDEMRMELVVVVEQRGQRATLEFEFPLLYRRRDDLELVKELGQVGWSVTAQGSTLVDSGNRGLDDTSVSSTISDRVAPSRVIAASIVALAAFAGFGTADPTWWSPLNVLGMIPAFLATNVIGVAAIAVPPVIFSLAFAAWCPNVWNGVAKIPIRSTALMVVALFLSMLDMTGGREDGLQYRGEAYVQAVTGVSIVWWVVVVWLFLSARRRPSPHRNLWFHLLLFVWLAWYAIPYMGELP
jgi:hypothetical protein